jgi:hypothetical protein
VAAKRTPDRSLEAGAMSPRSIAFVHLRLQFSVGLKLVGVEDAIGVPAIWRAGVIGTLRLELIHSRDFGNGWSPFALWASALAQPKLAQPAKAGGPFWTPIERYA